MKPKKVAGINDVQRMLLLQEKLANKQFLEDYSFADKLDGQKDYWEVDSDEVSDDELSSCTSDEEEW